MHLPFTCTLHVARQGPPTQTLGPPHTAILGRAPGRETFSLSLWRNHGVVQCAQHATVRVGKEGSRPHVNAPTLSLTFPLSGLNPSWLSGVLQGCTSLRPCIGCPTCFVPDTWCVPRTIAAWVTCVKPLRTTIRAQKHHRGARHSIPSCGHPHPIFVNYVSYL